MTHREIVDIAYRWVLKNGGCGCAFKEVYTSAMNGEYPDVIGFGAWGHSVLIEVKYRDPTSLPTVRNPFVSIPKKAWAAIASIVVRSV